MRLATKLSQLPERDVPFSPILSWKTLEDVWKTNFSPIWVWKTLIPLKELIKLISSFNRINVFHTHMGLKFVFRTSSSVFQRRMGPPALQMTSSFRVRVCAILASTSQARPHPSSQPYKCPAPVSVYVCFLILCTHHIATCIRVRFCSSVKEMTMHSFTVDGINIASKI